MAKSSIVHNLEKYIMALLSSKMMQKQKQYFLHIIFNQI
jgi:hypothetical protein